MTGLGRVGGRTVCRSAAANTVAGVRTNQDPGAQSARSRAPHRSDFVEPLSKRQLNAIVNAAFRELPADLRLAGGRARRSAPAASSGTPRTAVTAQRDAQYRRVLVQYQEAVEAAGSGWDPRMPNPELSRLRPSGGSGAEELSCMQRAEARVWPRQSRRPVSAGAPSLGKRR